MTDLSNRAATLFDLAKQYRASQVRSANENDIRTDIRETVEKLGLDSKSFQDSIRMELELTEGDRLDYVNGLQEMQEVLRDKATDLFGEEEMRKKEERIKKRQERAAAASAPPSTDSNPRSDPKRGGAGGADGKSKAKDGAPKKPGNKHSARGGGDVVGMDGKPVDGTTRTPPTEAELTAAAAAAPGAQVANDEQAEGAAILDGHLDTMKAEAGQAPAGDTGQPISQSAQAAAIRDNLGLT